MTMGPSAVVASPEVEPRRPLADEFAKAAHDSVYAREDGSSDSVHPSRASRRGERGPDRPGKDFDRKR